jgi:hypothetical protein
MAGSPEEMRARIEAYPWPPQRGGVEVVRANKGFCNGPRVVNPPER